MKSTILSRLPVFLAGGALALLISLFRSQPPALPEVQAAETAINPSVTAQQLEVARLKTIATDQSHVMADVGYHFANCWFAAEKKNWPLAKFYFDETRSHLNWAVRVIPIRKDAAGNNVDLKAILQAVDSTFLSAVGEAITAHDSEKFIAAYKNTLEGCYACHKSSGKPYLRPQIPVAPPQPIINYDPNAKWPE
jgi:hypothetical protein